MQTALNNTPERLVLFDEARSLDYAVPMSLVPGAIAGNYAWSKDK